MKNVVIIGGGPAGLTAAYELLKQSDQFNVIVLEKTDRLGGIACTVHHNGNYMDLGGHRFFSKNQAVTDWWMSLPGVKLQKRARKSEIYYDGKLFDYPIKANFKLLKMLGIKKSFLISTDYLRACIKKEKETSLEKFYINRFGKELYLTFFKNYTEKVWGISPDEISPDWGSQRVKGLNISELIKDCFKSIFGVKNENNTQTSLIDEFYYPEYGPGALWEAVANEVEKMGGTIKFGCEVCKIETEDNSIKQVEYRCNGVSDTLKTDCLISSMPIKNLIKGMSDVPVEIKNLSQNLIYRDFITVGVLTDKKVNHNNNCWIYLQDKNVTAGRIQIFNNWSSSLVKEPENTVWMGLEYFCSKGDEFWNMSDQDIEQLACSELVKVGFINDKSAVVDTHIERVEKAYPAYWGAYEKMDKIRHFLDEKNNLYCVGRNGQHRYNNMDHSMLTAFECVKNIVNNIDCKDNIWEVNTEKEYN